MKKIHLIISCIVFFFAIQIHAQEENRYFNHLDLSLEAGSTGIGIDIAMPVGNYLRVRTGASFMPKFQYSMQFKMQMGENEPVEYDNDGNPYPSRFRRMADYLEQFSGYSIKDEYIDVIGEPTFANFKLLIDIQPFKNKNWYFTAGFYAGSKRIGKAYNTTEEMPTLVAVNMYNSMYERVANGEAIIDYQGYSLYFPAQFEDKIYTYGRMGVVLGEYKESGDTYIMEPNSDCMVKANAYVNSIRPYFGCGYMGAPAKKSPRFKIGFDCGIMFWGGRPDIRMHDGTSLNYELENVRGQVGEYVDIINRFPVFPVLNFKIAYRIF